MAPLIYPEPTWSNGFGRVVRTLQIVAVAGAIGAVGGGVVVMALVGGGSSSRGPTALKVSTADSGKAAMPDNGAARPAGAAPAVSQPAAVTGTAQITEAAAVAAEAGMPQQSPAAAEPVSRDAASEQHPVEQAAAPAESGAGTNVYNRVEPEEKTAPAHAPHARAKKTPHRTKSAERGRAVFVSKLRSAALARLLLRRRRRLLRPRRLGRLTQQLASLQSATCAITSPQDSARSPRGRSPTAPS